VCAEQLPNIEVIMPEIRTSLSVELHRKLKGEAVSKGIHLKHLVAHILEEHVKGNKGNKSQWQFRGDQT